MNISRKQLIKQERHINPLSLDKKQKKSLIVGALVILSLVPIFRSGGKTGLNFWAWIYNHTIFAGPKPEFVPEEDYMTQMEMEYKGGQK